MNRRLVLPLIGLAAPLLVLTSLWRLPGGEMLFAALSVLFPVALMALGAQRRGTTGPTTLPLLLLGGLLLVVVVGLFAFRGRIEDGPWWGGLPAAAALQIYGLFVLPFLVSSLGYARTFDRWGLRRDELEMLRRRFPKSPATPEEPPPKVPGS